MRYVLTRSDEFYGMLIFLASTRCDRSSNKYPQGIKKKDVGFVQFCSSSGSSKLCIGLNDFLLTVTVPIRCLRNNIHESMLLNRMIFIVLCFFFCCNTYSLFSRDVMHISKCKIAEPLSFQLSLVIEHPEYILF